MELKGKRILVCNCEISMPLDGDQLARACGAEGACAVHTQLCRAQIERFKAALASGEPLVVGCTQEAPLFEETRAEFGPETAVAYANAVQPGSGSGASAWGLGIATGPAAWLPWRCATRSSRYSGPSRSSGSR